MYGSFYVFIFKRLLFCVYCLIVLLHPLLRCHRFHPSESLLRCTHLDNFAKSSKCFFYQPTPGWGYSTCSARTVFDSISHNIYQTSQKMGHLSRLWLLLSRPRLLLSWLGRPLLHFPGVKVAQRWEAVCYLAWPLLIPGNKQIDDETGLMDDKL